MKPGFVVSIRLNPLDCLRVLALIQDNVRSTMSFAQCVSLTLSSMLQDMEESGRIPTQDGFDYAEKMAPYKRMNGVRKKRVMTLPSVATHTYSPSTFARTPINTEELSQEKRDALQALMPYDGIENIEDVLQGEEMERYVHNMHILYDT